MEGYEFLTAHFVNDERTTVEVYWVETNENGEPGETIVEYVEAALDKDGRPVEGQPQWKALLEHIDIDQLHDNTARHMADQYNEFKRMVMDIAEKDGLIKPGELNAKDIIDFVFKPFDAKKDKEQLFMFKLQLFELDEIKASKNRAGKTALRKAANFLESLKHAIDIIESEK